MTEKLDWEYADIGDYPHFLAITDIGAYTIESDNRKPGKIQMTVQTDEPQIGEFEVVIRFLPNEKTEKPKQ